MFDIGIGLSEILLLAVLVILVVGPEELPKLLRTVGRYIGQVKRVADDFRAQVDDAIKEPMEDIQESIAGVSEDLDDDPFGEEDLIDFEEHNQKILDKEKADGKETDGDKAENQDINTNETATEKALRESGVAGLAAPAKPKKSEKTKKVEALADVADSDAPPVKKSGT
ncbi:MAG: Sec-independent protein translocase protein TatB [Hyphomicrobiaceae bacterium]|nr:Sec-independent protein translocase protein TatB [Hyphomicrobiaceae bacterium]